MARTSASDEAEATARAINAEPWEPMAGMVKRQCPQCRYFFAAPVDSTEPRCVIVYDWTVLELDAEGDVVENHGPYASLHGAVLAARHSLLPTVIELVRNETDKSGCAHRQWARIDDRRLPANFSGGAPIPIQFRDEVRKAWMRGLLP